MRSWKVHHCLKRPGQGSAIHGGQKTTPLLVLCLTLHTRVSGVIRKQDRTPRETQTFRVSNTYMYTLPFTVNTIHGRVIRSLKRKENGRKLHLLGIQTGDNLAKPYYSLSLILGFAVTIAIFLSVDHKRIPPKHVKM